MSPSLPARGLLGLIQIYKWTLSPLIGRDCRYLPTCSSYAADAVRQHGAWAGSWMAAARCTGVSAASCFYGRLIADLTDNRPKAPVMLHYGAHDASIPPENVERVRLAAPDSPLYLYDAGHGFCRAESKDYNAAAADLALARTLDWFARWRQEEHA